MATQSQIDRLTQQFESTMRKAWSDAIEDKMREDPPDYDWVTRLYTEVRDRLAGLLRTGSPQRTEIEEKLDPALFNQMIRHNVFQGQEFIGVVFFTFEKCMMLGSPARDEETTAKRDEVLGALYSGAVFAELIPLFFKNINMCIDWVYDDLRAIANRRT